MTSENSVSYSIDMKVYFVRHAESQYNELGIHQHAGIPLSENGKKQAEKVAKRLSSIPFDIILSSSHVRAKQTTEIINIYVKKDIVYTDLLGERKRPSEVVGQKFEHPQIHEIKEQIIEHRNDPEWHYSDEENIFDTRKRAEQFLEFLEARKEQEILVVTHSVFLRMIIACMAFGKEVSPDSFLRIEEFFKTRNTGITICEMKNPGEWRLYAWNDHAHLNE